MKPGQPCITHGGDTQGPDRHYRHFGVVKSVYGESIIIALHDGSEIKRTSTHVAIYLKAPANWPELYREQKVLHAPIQN